MIDIGQADGDGGDLFFDVEEIDEVWVGEDFEESALSKSIVKGDGNKAPVIDPGLIIDLDEELDISFKILGVFKLDGSG